MPFHTALPLAVVLSGFVGSAVLAAPQATSFAAHKALVSEALKDHAFANLYTYSRPEYVLIREARFSRNARQGGEGSAPDYCVQIVLIDPAADSAPRRKLLHFRALVAASQVTLTLDEINPPSVCTMTQGEDMPLLIARRSNWR